MRVRSRFFAALFLGLLSISTYSLASGTRSSGAGGSGGTDNRGGVGDSDREGLLQRGENTVEEASSEVTDGEGAGEEGQGCEKGQRWNKKAKKCVKKCGKGMRFDVDQDACVEKHKGKAKGKGKNKKK